MMMISGWRHKISCHNVRCEKCHPDCLLSDLTFTYLNNNFCLRLLLILCFVYPCCVLQCIFYWGITSCLLVLPPYEGYLPKTSAIVRQLSVSASCVLPLTGLFQACPHSASRGNEVMYCVCMPRFFHFSLCSVAGGHSAEECHKIFELKLFHLYPHSYFCKPL